jgi:hypothetical protein
MVFEGKSLKPRINVKCLRSFGPVLQACCSIAQHL